MDENESNFFKSVQSPKNKGNFSKNVILPFISGILGTSLVIGICFGVPEIKTKILGEEIRKTETSYDTKQNEIKEVTASAVSLKEYSGTAIGVAEKVQPSICRNRNRICFKFILWKKYCEGFWLRNNNIRRWIYINK